MPRPVAVALVACTALAFAASAAGAPAAAPRALRSADAPASQLRLERTIRVPGGGHILRYDQSVGGVPVLDSDVVAVAAPGAPAHLTADESANGLKRPGSPGVSRLGAIGHARRSAGLTHSGSASATRAILARGDGVLVWRVRLHSDHPLRSLTVLVDANSGRTFGVHDDLKQAGDVQARLFDPNAVMANNGYSGGIADNDDADSPLLTSLRRQVTLEDLTNAKGCLDGLWAKVRLGPAEKGVCRASGDYRGVKRHDDRFEALMSYFFVDRAQRYVQSLDLGTPIDAHPQFVGADAISADNSYYDPANRKMTLGTGGVDDAEDGDVITHEYGHALQDAQVRNFGENFPGEAFGEGFGDYFAAAVSAERAPQPASPIKDWNQCIFEWDATSYTSQMCGRRTTLTFTLPQAIAQANHDEHIVGEAWSSGLWSLRGELGHDPEGRSIMDRIVLESHFMLTTKPQYFQGAQALIDADQLLYGGAHCAPIAAEMTARKFFTPSNPAPVC